MNKRFLILTLTLISTYPLSFGQTFRGTTVEKGNNNPVEYVNIGIPFKNIGTVSNIKGEYLLTVPSGFDNDSVMFSCIGYEPVVIKITDLIQQENRTVYLEKNHMP